MQKSSVLTVTQQSYPQVKIRRLVTGKLLVFRFCLIGATLLTKQNSFPKELTDRILERAGLDGFLGNCHASGTQVLDDLGEEHMKTGQPIFYTSADSVFQIACHEETLA